MIRSFVIALVSCSLSASTLPAREWTDSTGMHTQDADLVDFDSRIVVLKKMNGHLVGVPIEKLSRADQEYLKSKEAKADVAGAASKDRTWTMTDGTKVNGRVASYGRKEIVIARRDGKLWVNEKPVEKLSEWHRSVLPRLVSQFEKREVKDLKGIESLIVARKGEPLVYTVEGVMLELDDGEMFAAPFFMFSDRDLAVLKPGWEAWMKADTDERMKEEESTKVRSMANEYQRNREAQDALVKLEMLQLASQWFDLWEVELIAPDGTSSSVVVPARDSRIAQGLAQKQCPACQIGATRKIRRRY